MSPIKHPGIPGNGLTIFFNIITSIIYTNIPGINIIKKMAKRGMAKGNPSPNGITNNTTITWNVSGVTDMHALIYRATEFNQPLNNWDVHSFVK